MIYNCDSIYVLKVQIIEFKMDNAEREILERNESLLLGNIIHSEDLYHHLKKECVLPDTMIRDIQSCVSQEDKNRKLLHTLKLRGGDSYRRFRHVLYLTGHLFLADQLYGEDYESRLFKAEDIFGKFPNIFKHVSDDVKSKFLRHMETKLKERALRSAWLRSGSDRNDFLDIKKANFDTEKEYRFKLEGKKKKIFMLHDEIDRLKEIIKMAEADKMILQRKLCEMRQGFKEDLSKQVRFNAANNNSVIQLRNRFDQFNDRVKKLNILLRGFFTEKEESELEEKSDDLKMSFLEENVKNLIQMVKSNMDKTSNSMNEKETVLNMLKTSGRKQQETLSEVVRHYVDKQEKGKASISRELEGLLETVRGSKFTAKFSARPRTDLKLIKTQVATLKEEVDHMRKKVDWKDGQITDLIQENTELKEQIAAFAHIKTTQPNVPRVQESLPKQDSPDSLQEINNVYQQFDKYINESYISRHVDPKLRRRGSLAEVNLEQEVSPPACRRDSKIENIDVVDILGSTDRSVMNGTSSERKSSLPNIFEANFLITQPRKEHSHSYLDSKVSFTSSGTQLDAMEENETRTPINKYTSDIPAENAKTKSKGRKKKEFEIPDFKMQGRRPSLAELVTIYEDELEANDLR